MSNITATPFHLYESYRSPYRDYYNEHIARFSCDIGSFDSFEDESISMRRAAGLDHIEFLAPKRDHYRFVMWDADQTIVKVPTDHVMCNGRLPLDVLADVIGMLTMPMDKLTVAAFRDNLAKHILKYRCSGSGI